MDFYSCTNNKNKIYTVNYGKLLFLPTTTRNISFLQLFFSPLGGADSQSPDQNLDANGYSLQYEAVRLNRLYQNKKCQYCSNTGNLSVAAINHGWAPEAALSVHSWRVSLPRAGSWESGHDWRHQEVVQVRRPSLTQLDARQKGVLWLFFSFSGNWHWSSTLTRIPTILRRRTSSRRSTTLTPSWTTPPNGTSMTNMALWGCTWPSSLEKRTSTLTLSSPAGGRR